MKVLLVEDLGIERMIMKRFLERNNHEVIEAENGAMAIKLLKIHKPDLVSLDLGLPDIDGISVLKNMKMIDGDMKIVVVTGMNLKSYIDEAIAIGINYYFVKPLNFESFANIIENIVNMKN